MICFIFVGHQGGDFLNFQGLKKIVNAMAYEIQAISLNMGKDIKKADLIMKAQECVINNKPPNEASVSLEPISFWSIISNLMERNLFDMIGLT